MTLATWFVVALLALKVVWNLGVPFVLLSRARARPDEDTASISMATSLDLALLVLAVTLSAFSKGESWVNRPMLVGLWSVVAIVVSYLNLVIVGIVGGWIVARRYDSNRRG